MTALRGCRMSRILDLVEAVGQNTRMHNFLPAARHTIPMSSAEQRANLFLSSRRTRNPLILTFRTRKIEFSVPRSD